VVIIWLICGYSMTNLCLFYDVSMFIRCLICYYYVNWFCMFVNHYSGMSIVWSLNEYNIIKIRSREDFLDKAYHWCWQSHNNELVKLIFTTTNRLHFYTYADTGHCRVWTVHSTFLVSELWLLYVILFSRSLNCDSFYSLCMCHPGIKIHYN